MITLDKSLQNQRIICTISEIEMADGNVPILKVENKQNNTNYTLNLPENSSLYKSRFDEFIFPTSQVNDWIEGKYFYAIWEYNSSTQQLVQELEIGLLQILDATKDSSSEYVSIAVDDTTDDYYVYDENNNI
jgi:hypothetical protein